MPTQTRNDRQNMSKISKYSYTCISIGTSLVTKLALGKYALAGCMS